MSTAEVLALIERLESDLAALKKAVQPQPVVDERERLVDLAARVRKAREGER